MSVSFSVAVKNGMLDAFETVVGASAVIKVRSGEMPVDCVADNVGDVLVEFKLPEDWLKDAADGKKVKVDDAMEAVGGVAGKATHWRLYNSAGEVCHAQGTVSLADGDGDMKLSSVDIAVGQKVTLSNLAMGF